MKYISPNDDGSAYVFDSEDDGYGAIVYFSFLDRLQNWLERKIKKVEAEEKRQKKAKKK